MPGHPSEDFATYGAHITKSIAAVVAAYGTAEDPLEYAKKISHRLLPNMLPYTVGTQASLGFVEWNGRSLTDHAPNVMFLCSEHSHPTRDRQRISHFEATKDVPLRSGCSIKIGRLGCGRADRNWRDIVTEDRSRRNAPRHGL